MKDVLVSPFIQLRTIEVFATKENRAKIYQEMGEAEKYCEVCCFWIVKEFRNYTLLNTTCWMTMACIVEQQECSYVVFGTNVKGMTMLYTIPKESVLYIQDIVNGRNTYIFLARRKGFLLGVWRIIWSKLLHRKNQEHNNQQRQQILSEIGIV